MNDRTNKRIKCERNVKKPFINKNTHTFCGLFSLCQRSCIYKCVCVCVYLLPIFVIPFGWFFKKFKNKRENLYSEPTNDQKV